MMHIFVILLLIGSRMQRSSSISYTPWFNDKTQINIVSELKYLLKSDNTSLVPMTSDVKEFTDLIKCNVMHVDKSLLIRSTMSGSTDCIISRIIAPQGWGKTTNLAMLKFFLEKKDNVFASEAYLYFVQGKIVANGSVLHLEKPPLLSIHNNTVNAHLGKYWIIYLDFGVHLNEFGNDLNDFYGKFANTIYDGVKHHIRYLINKLEAIVKRDDSAMEKCNLERLSRLREIFEKRLYLTEESEYKATVASCIQHICRLLEAHTKQRIVILLDEYDAFYNRIYFTPNFDISESVENSILNVLDKFTVATFKENGYFYRAVITGVLPVAIDQAFRLTGTLREYNVPLFGGKRLYYGFTKDEVKTMMRARGIPDSLYYEQVKVWYDGYQSLEHAEESVFRPLSMVEYIKTKNTLDWSGSVTIDGLVARFLKCYEIRVTLQCLLPHYYCSGSGENSLTGLPYYYLSTSNEKPSIALNLNYLAFALDTKRLRDFRNYLKENDRFMITHSHVIYTFYVVLLHAGYLTPSSSRSNPHCAKVVIPNRQLSAKLATEIEKADERLVHQQRSLLISLAKTLAMYMGTDDNSCERFKNETIALLTRARNCDNVKKQFERSNFTAINTMFGIAHQNEAVVHSLMIAALNCLASGNESSYVLVKKSPYRMDTFVYDQIRGRGAILRYKRGNENVSVNVSVLRETLAQANRFTSFSKDRGVPFITVKLIDIGVTENGAVLVDCKSMNIIEVREYVEMFKTISVDGAIRKLKWSKKSMKIALLKALTECIPNKEKYIYEHFGIPKTTFHFYYKKIKNNLNRSHPSIFADMSQGPELVNMSFAEKIVDDVLSSAHISSSSLVTDLQVPKSSTQRSNVG